MQDDEQPKEVVLPEMTPLQALVVNTLFGGERSSRYIQDEMGFRGVEMKMTLVYRLLGRMEMARYICGRYRQWQTPDGRTIRERHYRVTDLGLDEWKRTMAFYEAMLPPREGFEPVSADGCLYDK